MFASMRKVSIPTDDVDSTSLVYPERISPSIRSRFLLFDAAAIVEWNSELVAIQTADARDRIALSAHLGLAGALLRFRNTVSARTNRSCELRRLASWSSVIQRAASWAASPSSSARIWYISPMSRDDGVETTALRRCSWATIPWASKRDNASRIGVRLTANSSASVSCLRRIPGAYSPETHTVSLWRAVPAKTTVGGSVHRKSSALHSESRAPQSSRLREVARVTPHYHGPARHRAI